MRVLVSLLVAILLVVPGCRKSDIYDSIVAEDARPRIEAALGAIEAGDTEAIMALMPVPSQPDAMHAQLTAFLATAPTGPWVEAPELAGAHRFWRTDTRTGNTETLNVVYLTANTDGPVRIDLVLLRPTDDTPWQMNYFNIYSFTPNPSLLGLEGMLRPGKAIALALGIGSLGLIVITLIASFRFRRVKRRILWTIFILFGYPVVAFNWTTEAWRLMSPAIQTSETGIMVNLFDIAFFGAGFVDNSPAEAALLSIGVPIGALLFWYRVMRGGPTRKAEPVPR